MAHSVQINGFLGFQRIQPTMLAQEAAYTAWLDTTNKNKLHLDSGESPLGKHSSA